MNNLTLMFLEFLFLAIGLSVGILLVLHSRINRRKRSDKVHVTALKQQFGFHFSAKPKIEVFIASFVIFGFLIAFIPLNFVRINTIEASEFFVEETVPIWYWVGIIILCSVSFVSMALPRNKKYEKIFLLSTILLMISIRMIFPIIYSDPAVYEPDVFHYTKVLSSWVNSGVDFGSAGAYQHDYPMAYLVAYFFTKFTGIPISLFLRLAPFVIYVADISMLYLLFREIFHEDIEKSLAGIFLFSFSPLNYWIAVHYSPDLMGTFFYIVSLYFAVKFAKTKEWNLQLLVFACAVIFGLMLSHHLGIFYLILTLFGFAFSSKFLEKSSETAIKFFVLGVYSYTTWWVYGHFMYPSFFDVYQYFQGYPNPVIQLQLAGVVDQVAFFLYPSFILLLFALATLRSLGVKKPRDLFTVLRYLFGLTPDKKAGVLLIYSSGFIFVGALFAIGLVFTAVYPLRVLEVLLIGLCPVSSLALVSLRSSNPSKKKTVLIFIVTIIVVLISIHRYYRQIQRRVLLQ